MRTKQEKAARGYNAMALMSLVMGITFAVSSYMNFDSGRTAFAIFMGVVAVLNISVAPALAWQARRLDGENRDENE